MKKCPFCAEDIHDKARKCKHCLEWIKDEEKDLTTQNEIGPYPSLSGSLEDIEKQTIINALKAQGGNKKATAKVLGIAYSTMCEKVKKYKIEL